MARALRSSVNSSLEAVKPEPPADLWEKLEGELQRMAEYVPPKPPGAFTSLEFGQRFGLTENQTFHRLRYLSRQGKLKRYGHSGRNVYYLYSENGVFPDDGTSKPGTKPSR